MQTATIYFIYRKTLGGNKELFNIIEERWEPYTAYTLLYRDYYMINQAFASKQYELVKSNAESKMAEQMPILSSALIQINI